MRRPLIRVLFIVACVGVARLAWSSWSGPLFMHDAGVAFPNGPRFHPGPTRSMRAFCQRIDSRQWPGPGYGANSSFEWANGLCALSAMRPINCRAASSGSGALTSARTTAMEPTPVASTCGNCSAPMPPMATWGEWGWVAAEGDVGVVGQEACVPAQPADALWGRGHCLEGGGEHGAQRNVAGAYGVCAQHFGVPMTAHAHAPVPCTAWTAAATSCPMALVSQDL